MRRPRGFTLVELMIVISVIAILAGIALPNLLSSRLAANESAAIEGLRQIASAQVNFKLRIAISNGLPDGQGEYGYLAELAGVVPLRGSAAILTPATLAPSVGTVSNTVGSSNGYLFGMYLPAPGGAGIAEDANGGKAAPAVLSSALSKRCWVVYAWPAVANQSGRRVFVVNQEGEILATDNRGAAQGYSGPAAAPTFDAAFTVAGDMTSDLGGQGFAATDAGTWVTVN